MLFYKFECRFEYVLSDAEKKLRFSHSMYYVEKRRSEYAIDFMKHPPTDVGIQSTEEILMQIYAIELLTV